MTIEEAVKVLNERRHNGDAKWSEAPQKGDPIVQSGDMPELFFTEFEAIAIAEKYERDDKQALMSYLPTL